MKTFKIFGRNVKKPSGALETWVIVVIVVLSVAIIAGIILLIWKYNNNSKTQKEQTEQKGTQNEQTQQENTQNEQKADCLQSWVYGQTWRSVCIQSTRDRQNIVLLRLWFFLCILWLIHLRI